MKKIFVSLLATVFFAACGNRTAETPASAAGTAPAEETVNPVEYKTNNPENMEEVCKFLKDCGYYFLATADGDQPRVRPFGTVNIFEGKLYIQSGKKKNVARQIAENPKVEICAFNAGRGNWIRVETTLVPDERVEAKASMLDAHPSLKKMYAADDDNTIVYFMTKTKATISSFSEPEKVIEF